MSYSLDRLFAHRWPSHLHLAPSPRPSFSLVPAAGPPGPWPRQKPWPFQPPSRGQGRSLALMWRIQAIWPHRHQGGSIWSESRLQLCTTTYRGRAALLIGLFCCSNVFISLEIELFSLVHFVRGRAILNGSVCCSNVFISLEIELFSLVGVGYFLCFVLFIGSFC